MLKYFRRFALLCSINSVFWYFILSTLYLPIGPWFLGEIVENYLGICFAWGIFVNGQLLKVDFQFMFAIFHVINLNF
jgi:hypothetical protein